MSDLCLTLLNLCLCGFNFHLHFPALARSYLSHGLMLSPQQAAAHEDLTPPPLARACTSLSRVKGRLVAACSQRLGAQANAVSKHAALKPAAPAQDAGGCSSQAQLAGLIARAGSTALQQQSGKPRTSKQALPAVAASEAGVRPAAAPGLLLPLPPSRSLVPVVWGARLGQVLKIAAAEQDTRSATQPVAAGKGQRQGQRQQPAAGRGQLQGGDDGRVLEQLLSMPGVEEGSRRVRQLAGMQCASHQSLHALGLVTHA